MAQLGPMRTSIAMLQQELVAIRNSDDMEDGDDDVNVDDVDDDDMDDDDMDDDENDDDMGDDMGEDLGDDLPAIELLPPRQDGLLDEDLRGPTRPPHHLR